LKRSYFLFCYLITAYCISALSLWKAETPGIRFQAVYSPVIPFYYPEISNFNHIKNSTYRLSGDLYNNLSGGGKKISAQLQACKKFNLLIKLNNTKTWRMNTESSMLKNFILGTTDTGSFFTDERCVNGFALIVKIPDKTIHSM
jgi:hypothetical protein